jgi:hypothetical protein
MRWESRRFDKLSVLSKGILPCLAWEDEYLLKKIREAINKNVFRMHKEF